MRLGYSIEIFEKDVEIGGKLRQVIPEERLNQDILNIELEILKSDVEFSQEQKLSRIKADYLLETTATSPTTRSSELSAFRTTRL